MQQASKMIIEANIAAHNAEIDEVRAASLCQIAEIKDYLLGQYADYDSFLEFFGGEEPTFSRLGFIMSEMTLSPEEAKRVSDHMQDILRDVLIFNMSEAEQPEDVIDAM